MQKSIKRTLALILAVMLCLGSIPFAAFATEAAPSDTVSSEAAPSEIPVESSQPEPTQEPEDSSVPSPMPEELPEPSEEPATEPEDIYETEGTSVDVYQVWPAMRRAQARAAGVGTGGTLQIGSYCFKSEVGYLSTLNYQIHQLPAKTMLAGGTHTAAYCLEIEKGATGGTPYTWTDMSVSAQDTVGTIMALGFRWTSSSAWAGPSDNGDKWAVTQLMIWEAVGGHIFLQANGLFGVQSGVDADMQKCSSHAYNPTGFTDYYRDLKKRLNDYMKVPSFASKSANSAETITLRWDGSKYSATVTDSNSILRNYNFSTCLQGVKVVPNGNSLTLSSTEPILSPKVSSRVESDNNLSGGKGAVAVWRTSDSSQQNFATYNADGGEPVGCYIKVKTDAVGNASLNKTAEDGKVGGLQFQISGDDGSSTTKTTDANGNIDMEGMPIYKADGSKITYTATEINVPNRYVKPDSKTFQLTEGQTASIQFENKLKRWRVTVTKADRKTGSTAQGNASLKGAVFGVYQGGTLVKEYTVGDDLTFTTDYYPYGEDWALKEISAGEGYKVSSTVTDLCEIPAGTNDEFNDNAVTVTNEVMRGGVSVQKRDSQTGTTPQGDANFAGIVFEIINDSTNTVEVDGRKAAPGQVAKEITTNAQGFATTGPNCLPYGKYTIREKSTNDSMLKTFTEEIPVTVSEDGKVYEFTADNDVVRGGIAVEKHDSQTGATPQGNSDFSGIVFEIINSSANPVVVGGTTYAPGSVVTTIATNENGHAETADDALPYGRYIVREKETNKSMLLTWPEQQITVSANKKMYTVTAVDDVVRGGISVEKRDTITGCTPQGDADFEGVVFEVINNSRNPVIVNDESIAPGEVALTLTTDVEGKCSSAPDALPFGEYVLHEKSTNESMLNTAPDQTFIIDEHLKMYQFYMDNEVVRGGVLIEKRDLESLLLTPLGGASLDGTLFEITNKSKRAVYVNGALYEPDTVCLTIEVKDGVAQSGDHALPYGTYSMVESKPGKGYLWTDKKVRDFTVRKDGEVTEYREGEAAYNQVIRGDLKFVKVGEKNMHRFANVAFKLTSQTTGESHILVTDENGEVRTENQWNAHSLNTNGNDDKPELEWDDLTGSWYGLTTEGWIVKTQDGLAALPFDQYTLEELRCEGNKGYELVTVPNITISRDNTVINLGTIDDHEGENPEIHTTATAEDEKAIEPLSKVTIVDSVCYSGLTPGKTYKLSGILMDKESGKPLEIDGKQVTAEKEFTPKTSSGTEELSYTFDASALAEKSVVVFEDLFQGDTKVTSHADIEDEGQTVTFTEPKIGTTATVNGEHTAEPVGEITIIDTVAYSGLIVGKEYIVKGVLMDKATGEKLLVDDKEITAEAKFRASKPEGTIDIPFVVDSSVLAGKTVVVFETLYRDKLEVCAHTDIEDEGQTVTFKEKPEIKTKATVDGEKEVDPLETITITDTVTYKNLTPGKTYQVKGVLMDKGTGEKLLIDGKEVTAESIFIPEKPTGTVELPFTFPASALAGKSIVVFESLYHEGKEVAVHADIEDEDQTITIRHKGGLLIRKTSEDDFVEGISFIVAGNSYEETFTTDKQGEIYVQDLVPGEYTVTEVENDVTAKYIIEEGKTVTVTSGDEPIEVEFHNKLKRGSVYVIKTAEGAPDANLPGAEFSIYADVDNNGEFDAETDTLFGKLEYSDKEYHLDNLLMGGYFLREDKASEGYTADNGYYFFKLSENGERVEVTNTADQDAGFVNQKQTGFLRIVKVEKGTEKHLEGATFCVKDENGQVVAEGKTNKDGEILFESLPFGSYTYQEIYAPEGYKLDDTEHKFEINGKNVEVKVTFENEKTPATTTSVPKTGDARPNPWIIGGIGLAMLACAARLIWYLRKHRRT